MDVTVVVTWPDGSQETFTCYDIKVREGVLYMTHRMHSGRPVQAIPLTSLRSWTEERR